MLFWGGVAADYGDYGDSWDFLFGLCQQGVFRWGLRVEHPFGMEERAACVLVLFTTKITKVTKPIEPAYRSVLLILKDRKARNLARCASSCIRNAFRRLREAA